MKQSYSEKLRDPRWLCKRAEVIEAADRCCQYCGKNEEELGQSLEVHHSFYLRGREPWEYPNEVLFCLCRSDHCDRQALEENARIELSILLTRLQPNEIEAFTTRLRQINAVAGRPDIDYDAWTMLSASRGGR